MAKLNGSINGWMKVVVIIIGLIATAAVIKDDLGETIDKVDAHEPRIQQLELTDAKSEERMKRIEDKLDDFIQEQRAVNTQVIEYLRTTH